jgi:uncharacterized protein YjiS (DUF1127 family)
MRIVGQERSDVSPSELETDEAETAYSAIFLGSVNRPSLIGQREDAGSFVDSYPGGEAPQVGNDSPQSQSEPDAARRPIAAAMSWLATCVIEGFAAYGEAMYFVDPSEVIDRRDLERNLQARDRHENEVPWMSAGCPPFEDFEQQPRTQTTFSAWSARLTSGAIRFLSRIRRDPQRAPTIATLEALDDRTLRDIGILRSPDDSVAGYRDQYNWLNHGYNRLDRRGP